MTSNSRRPNIVLAGFMGTGKSTVGRIVARTLLMPYRSTDAAIVELAGRSIAEIFAQDGEKIFRRIEATVCEEMAMRDGQVIDTGGGALLNPRTREIFGATGLLVCLRADLDTIAARVGDDPSRPLFGTRTDIEQLYAARAPIYASLPFQIDTTGRTPDEVAEEIVELWKQHR
ncbi:MAG: shikimate kinase [Anaerolineae bacterium]|nr:shikimate kinase [Anaerolineae bacterium]